MSTTRDYTERGIGLFEDGTLVGEWVWATRTYEDIAAGSSRPFTAEENEEAQRFLDERRREGNEADLLTRARGAIIANSAWLDRTSAPTNAQVVQQVDRLTRQVNSLLKLRLGDLLDTAGT